MLLICTGLLAATSSAAAAASTAFTVASSCALNGVVVNPLAGAITLDGQFTGGVLNGVVQGEWSNVTPACFISPSSPGGTLLRTDSLADANSLLYAAIAPGVSEPGIELYLMYAYAPRANQIFAPGEFVADIAFPLTVQGDDGLASQAITVQVRGGQTSSFFDVFVDLGLGAGSQPAGQFGIDGVAGFGPSPLSANHLLIELEVPLLIDPGFFNNDGPGPLPEGGSSGPDGGGYSPAPAFWGASIAKDAGDPPASSALFTINHDGSTTVDASHIPTVPTVPEPGALGLGMLGLIAAVRRRRL